VKQRRCERISLSSSLNQHVLQTEVHFPNYSSIMHYTRCKFRVLPTSRLGMAITSVIRGWKLAVLCLTLEPHRFKQEDRYTF